MINHKKGIIWLLVMMCTISTSYAFLGSGSNFRSTYPKHECRKPQKPYGTPDERETERYKREGEEYISCIDEYAYNADNDIRTIEDAKRDAIDEKRFSTPF